MANQAAYPTSAAQGWGDSEVGNSRELQWLLHAIYKLTKHRVLLTPLLGWKSSWGREFGGEKRSYRSKEVQMESQPILATILLPHMLGQAVWEGFLLHEDVDNESCPTSPPWEHSLLSGCLERESTLWLRLLPTWLETERCATWLEENWFFFQSQCLRGESLLLAKMLPCVMGEIVTLIFK